MTGKFLSDEFLMQLQKEKKRVTIMVGGESFDMYEIVSWDELCLFANGPRTERLYCFPWARIDCIREELDENEEENKQ